MLQTQAHSPKNCHAAYQTVYASSARCYAHFMIHMQTTVSTEVSWKFGQKFTNA
jgi:hypothetical protein